MSGLEVGWKQIRKAINIDGFLLPITESCLLILPCWCVSDLIIFQDQALKESLHEHGVKVSFFWSSNNWISIFSMLLNSGFHQTQDQSLICLVHNSLTLWFHVVEAWTIWQKLLKIITRYKLVMLMLVFVQVLMLILIL